VVEGRGMRCKWIKQEGEEKRHQSAFGKGTDRLRISIISGRMDCAGVGRNERTGDR
jgi:hypothetical protein